MVESASAALVEPPGVRDSRRSLRLAPSQLSRVLIVAYYFPPVATSGALRPLGFCRYLESSGWRPQVLTTTPESIVPSLAVDPTLSDRLPASVRVDAVAYQNPLQTIIKWRDAMRTRGTASSAGEPHVGAEDLPGSGLRHRLVSRLRSAKEAALARAFSFPDQQSFWHGPAVKHASQWPRSARPDVVLATAPPWTALTIAHALARRFDVPFVVDFRDPWTRSPYHRSHSSSLARRARELERKMCSAAAAVIANTVELRDQLRCDYPQFENRIVTITNGFDARAIDVPSGDDRDAATANPNGPIEICHFGTVYGQRSPRLLFQAVADLARQGRVGPDRLRLRFVGAWDDADPECTRLAGHLETLGLLTRERPVPHAECLRQMRKAGVLLVLQPASPLQVPGKIFEYIATGRPLLVIGGEGATAGLVARHQLGRCVRNDDGVILNVISDLIDGAASPHPQRTDSMTFDYPELTRQLAEVLDCVHSKRQIVQGW